MLVDIDFLYKYPYCTGTSRARGIRNEGVVRYRGPRKVAYRLLASTVYQPPSFEFNLLIHLPCLLPPRWGSLRCWDLQSQSST